MLTPIMTTQPLSQYFNEREIHLDAAQQMVLQQLQGLTEALLHFKRSRKGRINKWLSRTPPPLGLYMWGSVGRGKTLMMDAFYQQLPYRRKRRIHFHALMQELDEAFRIQTAGSDPMANIVASMAESVRVLCIDEISITSISDAMMFARMLHHAATHGIVLITTSNVPPDRLYQDGLQRERFLPAIDLLKTQVSVAYLDSPTDYRLQKVTGKNLWQVNTADCEPFLENLYTALTQAPIRACELKVLGRKLAVRAAHKTTLWADFDRLCGSGRTVDDYQDLVVAYHAILLSNIPAFTLAHRDPARRFIWLIDVLYDARILLIATAQTPIPSLFAADINMPETERTISRLLEMQSDSYQSQGYRETRWQGN